MFSETGRRLAPLTGGIAIAAGGGYLLAARLGWLWGGAWWVGPLLGAAFLATESSQVHLEIRRHTFSLSLSEIPLVLGLFTLGAAPLALARCGAALVVGLRRRTNPAKLVFNLCLFGAETVAAVCLFSATAGRHAAPSHGVLGACLAIAAVTMLSGTLVLAAITLLQGRPSPTDMSLVYSTALGSAIFNVTVAVLMLLAVRETRAVAPLLAGLLVVTALSYRSYSGLVRRQRTLSKLHDLTRMVGAAASDPDGFGEVLGQAREVLQADFALLWLPGSAPRGSTWTSGTLASADLDRLLADPGIGTVIASGNGLVYPRFRGELSLSSWPARYGLRDAVLAAVPGKASSGLLLVADRRGEMASFTEVDLQLAEVVASHLGVALDNAGLLSKLRHDAEHDALTGLPNRVYFDAQVTRALSAPADGSFAVLLMDLDGFKEINDTLGHHRGDTLLEQVAARLRDAVAPEVVLARLGGDEFAALVPAAVPSLDPLVVAEAMQRALSRPFELDDLVLEVRASLGVATYPEHGRNGASLLQRADIAMYAAKASHEPVMEYEPALDRSNPERLALVSELRHAIDAGQMVLHYQPKIDLATDAVVGFEALVRWAHPRLGLLPPDEFIPIAEHTGLIVALTRRVLGDALDQAKRWHVAGHVLSVAVNVSARALLAPGFLAEVTRALSVSGLPPDLLVLEITETGVMVDPARALSVLTDLRAAGVQLSVDDFGTGYSSLAYLQQLPVHEVKIDKSFVLTLASDAGNAAIIRAVIDLGHSLGLQVLAEGVEDQQSAQLLGRFQCDSAQGYLFSRPMPAAAVEAWFARRRSLRTGSKRAGSPVRLTAVN